SKDIRTGYMPREQGVELVRRHDHVKPRDLARWLEYTGMTEAAFDAIADGFRDPRVWGRENGQWIKDNIWDQELSVVAAQGADIRSQASRRFGDDGMCTALREQDIRPADLMAAKRGCIERDRAFLLDREDRFVRVPCPACES